MSGNMLLEELGWGLQLSYARPATRRDVYPLCLWFACETWRYVHVFWCTVQSHTIPGQKQLANPGHGTPRVDWLSMVLGLRQHNIGYTAAKG